MERCRDCPEPASNACRGRNLCDLASDPVRHSHILAVNAHDRGEPLNGCQSRAENPYWVSVGERVEVGDGVSVRRFATAPGPSREAPAVPVGTQPLGEPLDDWAYVSTERLMRDAQTLASALPSDVDAVVAIARSGLLVGSLLASSLHVPLRTVSQATGVVNPGHGYRMIGHDAISPRHVVLVDDTVATGREMVALRPVVEAAFPGARVTRAVVYCHPYSVGSVDVLVSLYGGMHYLEWSWPNAGHGAACALDFDGILCHDCPPGDDDDGPRYRAFLRGARPLFLPRRRVVPLIVTARHEKYRGLTEDWLRKHGVWWGQLVMRDWDFNPARDWNTQVGEFKAKHYGESECVLMAESEPQQAILINGVSGKPVLCPSLGRVLPPRVVVPVAAVPVATPEPCGGCGGEKRGPVRVQR